MKTEVFLFQLVSAYNVLKYECYIKAVRILTEFNAKTAILH